MCKGRASLLLLPPPHPPDADADADAAAAAALNAPETRREGRNGAAGMLRGRGHQ